jgi:hypothetical protein
MAARDRSEGLDWPLQVGAWAIAVRSRRSGLSRRMLRSALDDLAIWELTHLGKLLLGDSLLRHEARLNAVKEPFEPAHELRLGNAKF